MDRKPTSPLTLDELMIQINSHATALSAGRILGFRIFPDLEAKLLKGELLYLSAENDTEARAVLVDGLQHLVNSQRSFLRGAEVSRLQPILARMGTCGLGQHPLTLKAAAVVQGYRDFLRDATHVDGMGNLPIVEVAARYNSALKVLLQIEKEVITEVDRIERIRTEQAEAERIRTEEARKAKIEADRQNNLEKIRAERAKVAPGLSSLLKSL